MELAREHFKAYVFIEYCRGQSPTEIIRQLRESDLENLPAESIIFAWVKGFREGSITSLSDAPRCGRPLSSASTPSIEALENLIRENPRQSIRHLAEHLNMGKETVRTILHRELNLRKVCSVWVPHVLSDRNKIQRKECATNVIAFFDCNSMDFILQHFAVEDETWVLFDTPRNKQENKVWIKPGEPRSRIPRPVLTVKKALLLLAFTGDGKISASAKSPRDTITADAYIHFVRNRGVIREHSD